MSSLYTHKCIGWNKNPEQQQQCVRCEAEHNFQKPADFMVNQGAWFLYDHQVEQIKLRMSSEGWLS